MATHSSILPGEPHEEELQSIGSKELDMTEATSSCLVAKSYLTLCDSVDCNTPGLDTTEAT